MIPQEYVGKEQAFVKHRLLETYLNKLFMIVGKHHDLISYVDCFAGPWTDDSEDLEGTSISLSLRIMRDCAAALEKMGRKVRFRALYIEKNRVAYGRLEAYLRTRDFGVETESYNGDFYHLRGKVLEWAGTDGFAFFFIDPFGWKNIVEPDTLRPLFQRPNSEYLVNFMLDFLRRTTGIGVHDPDTSRIFGPIPNLDGRSAEEKEKILVRLYREKLKAAFPANGQPPCSVSLPILYPDKDRTLYHLVYLTRHPLGIVKFMEASDASDIIQRRVRKVAKQDRRIKASGQEELFSALEVSPVEEPRVEPEEVERYWLAKLSLSSIHFGIRELAAMQEETGWFESDLQAAFGRLQKDGRVKNLDDRTSKRRSIFVHFTANHNEGERLVKI
jgi:three-Cys-motif partner protein